MKALDNGPNITSVTCEINDCLSCQLNIKQIPISCKNWVLSNHLIQVALQKA